MNNNKLPMILSVSGLVIIVAIIALTIGYSITKANFNKTITQLDEDIALQKYDEALNKLKPYKIIAFNTPKYYILSSFILALKNNGISQETMQDDLKTIEIYLNKVEKFLQNHKDKANLLDNKDLENLSFVYATIKNYPKALEYIKKLALKEPNNSEWQTRIAYFEDMNYNKEAAQQIYTSTYQKDPDNPINAWYYVGRVLWFDFDKKEKRDEAKTILNKIIENPMTLQYKLLLERSYNMLGYICENEALEQSNSSEYLQNTCIPLYEQSVKINPGFCETLFAIAKVYIRTIVNLNGGAYIISNPNISNQTYNNNLIKAIDYISTGLQNCQDSDGLFLMGLTYEIQTQYTEAEKYYIQAIEFKDTADVMLQSENDNLKGVVYTHLATIYLKENNESKAIESIKNMKKYYQYTNVPEIIENLSETHKDDPILQKLNELIKNN